MYLIIVGGEGGSCWRFVKLLLLLQFCLTLECILLLANRFIIEWHFQFRKNAPYTDYRVSVCDTVIRKTHHAAILMRAKDMLLTRPLREGSCLDVLITLFLGWGATLALQYRCMVWEHAHISNFVRVLSHADHGHTLNIDAAYCENWSQKLNSLLNGCIYTALLEPLQASVSEM